jgi:hypothetical protein
LIRLLETFALSPKINGKSHSQLGHHARDNGHPERAYAAIALEIVFT